jgi:two-component system, NarL family, nitrate/nitrite response regulator NarL
MDDAVNSIRILIADEQPVFRQGLCRLLESARDVCVVGEASNAATVVNLVRQLKPQVLLLSLERSGASELAQLKSIANAADAPRIIAMLPSIEETQVIDALRLGAYSIVLKPAAPTMLLRSIRDVAAGNYVLGREVLTILVRALRGFLSADTRATSPIDFSLTRRELEIIAKITGGLSNKEVGQEFSISERTVKHHLTNIFNKIGVSNRLSLALFAVNHQLMTAPPSDGPRYAGSAGGSRSAVALKASSAAG